MEALINLNGKPTTVEFELVRLTKLNKYHIRMTNGKEHLNIYTEADTFRGLRDFIETNYEVLQ